MSTPRSSSPDRRVAVTAVALVLLALAATVAVRAGGSAQTAAGAELDHPSIGDPDAPVVLVEYSDFGCPFCRRHARDVRPAIIEDYVETGIVRYEWRDFPLQGPSSRTAALAARAAQEQGRFWEYHSGLFEGGSQNISGERLRELAEELELDLEAFDAALADAAHEPLLDADEQEARDLGFTGTPSFTVNGEEIMGAQPFETFAEVIERAASAAEG